MKQSVIWLVTILLTIAPLGCDIADPGIDPGTDPEGECDPSWGSLDENTGLCWQNPAAPDALDWEEAATYCDELSLGGNTDWSLPSRQDFIDMLEGCDSDVLDYIEDSCEDYYESGSGFGYCDSCSDSSTCSGLFGSDSNWYWTSLSDCECAPNSVDLYDGYFF